jgi:hypothetical protein
MPALLPAGGDDTGGAGAYAPSIWGREVNPDIEEGLATAMFVSGDVPDMEKS